MKSKSFIPSPKRYTDPKKPTDYWGVLFISFILVSSMSCFLFANHSDKNIHTLSDTAPPLSTMIVDLDQSSKSEMEYAIGT